MTWPGSTHFPAVVIVAAVTDYYSRLDKIYEERIALLDRQIKQCDDGIKRRDELIEDIDSFVKWFPLAIASPLVVIVPALIWVICFK